MENNVVQGLVRAVGVSNYGPKQLLKIHDYLKARGVPLSSAQVLYISVFFPGIFLASLVNYDLL